MKILRNVRNSRDTLRVKYVYASHTFNEIKC